MIGLVGGCTFNHWSNSQFYKNIGQYSFALELIQTGPDWKSAMYNMPKNVLTFHGINQNNGYNEQYRIPERGFDLNDLQLIPKRGHDDYMESRMIPYGNVIPQ